MGLASSRYAGTIGAKNNDVKFFFNFFFVGCGGAGCGGAWVWGALLRCGARGCVGVGVEVLGCGAAG